MGWATYNGVDALKITPPGFFASIFTLGIPSALHEAFGFVHCCGEGVFGAGGVKYEARTRS
jgi:hypothetical protein